MAKEKGAIMYDGKGTPCGEHNYTNTDDPNTMRCLSCGKEFKCKNPLGIAREIPNTCPHCGADTYIFYSKKDKKTEAQ